MTFLGDAGCIGGLTKVTIYPMCLFAPKDFGPCHSNTGFEWIQVGKLHGYLQAVTLKEKKFLICKKGMIPHLTKISFQIIISWTFSYSFLLIDINNLDYIFDV